MQKWEYNGNPNSLCFRWLMKLILCLDHVLRDSRTSSLVMACVLILIYNEKNGSSDKFHVTHLVSGKTAMKPEPTPLSVVFSVSWVYLSVFYINALLNHRSVDSQSSLMNAFLLQSVERGMKEADDLLYLPCYHLRAAEFGFCYLTTLIPNYLFCKMTHSPLFTHISWSKSEIKHIFIFPAQWM